MKARADAAGLTVGLLFLLIAAVGLWSAFGTVDWTNLGIALPLALVAIGVVGLNSTRSK